MALHWHPSSSERSRGRADTGPRRLVITLIAVGVVLLLLTAAARRATGEEARARGVTGGAGARSEGPSRDVSAETCTRQGVSSDDVSAETGSAPGG